MPAFTPPPPAPQRGDRATFSPRVDAFLMWLVGLIPQLNSFFASLTSLASGGAASFSYSFDAITNDSDPGPGSLRLASSSQSTAMSIRIDNVTDDGVDITSYLSALASGTSQIKGAIKLQKVNDPSRWLLFDITGVTDAGGYRNLAVQTRAASMPTPFVAGDNLMVYFDRKGDKGEGGNTPSAEEMRAAIGTLPIANGGTGSTTASGAKTNLALNNVDNTRDIDKPVSTAQANADAQRVAKAGDCMSGNLVFNNGVGIFGIDTGGGTRQIFKLDGDNNLNFTVPGGLSINYYNQAGTQIVASLTNGGIHTAVKHTSTSDERLKINWRQLSDSFLEDFAAIERAGLFDWKETGETDGGIGAQSLQKIAPWATFENNGILQVNHAAINTVVLHMLTRRVLRNEVKA